MLAIASQQLQLAGNVRAALLALQLAEARLARADRPQFLPVRRALARDIERLKALPALDVAGMSARIDGLVAGGGFAAARLRRAQRAPGRRQGGCRRQGGFWSRLGSEVWGEVRQLVVVRQVGSNEPPLLPPPQAYFLRENLRLRLLNARLSLLDARRGRLPRGPARRAGLDPALLRRAQQAGRGRAGAAEAALGDLDQLRDADASPRAWRRCAASSRAATRAPQDEIAVLAAGGVRRGGGARAARRASTPGYVLFFYPPWRVEMSMVFFAVAALVVVRCCSTSCCACSATRSRCRPRCAPGARGAGASARTPRSPPRCRPTTKAAMRAPRRKPAFAFDNGPSPGVAALLAARAAHQMRDFERARPLARARRRRRARRCRRRAW